MKKENPYKIIIIQDDDALNEKAKAMLIKAGYGVRSVTSAADVLTILGKEKKSPVFLLICGVEVTQKDSKNVLEKIKNISPLTQVLLIVPFNEPEKLIHYINSIKIDSCISFPFQSEDLINQVEDCFKRFDKFMKQAIVKEVIGQQNLQLYKIAQDFSKKKRKNKSIIKEKDRQLRKLKNYLESDFKNNTPDEISIVENLIRSKKLPQNRETYLNEFNEISEHTISIFNKIAQNNSVKFNRDAAIEDIINQEYSKPVHFDLIKKMVSYLVSIQKNKKEEKQNNENPPNLSTIFPENDPLNEYFEIGVTSDHICAYLKIIKNPGNEDKRKEIFTLSIVLQYLSKCGVCFGIIPAVEIEFWLKTADASSEPLAIAVGKSPIHGRPSIIKYHFPFDYSNAGKLNEDGIIDFRDRGDVPYVSEGDLLAEKIPAVKGKSGRSITNYVIPAEDMADPDLVAGPGTRISEDGIQIFSTIKGMPHLDKMDAITVIPELHIEGDVSYATGNINFAGNILVTGIVRDGFQVNGMSLTATHIEGGKIELTKDLSVLDGIVSSNINAAGSINVKYVHNSQIEGFCDVIVNKEIIDSNINISGTLKIETGKIINSTIVANCGIEAGNIGSYYSAPCKLMINVNKYVQGLINDINTSRKDCDENIAKVEKKIKELECQNIKLLEKVTKKTQAQDRLKIASNQLKEGLSQLKPLKNNEQIQNLKKIGALEKMVGEAELKLNIAIDRQEKIDRQIQDEKEQIIDIEQKKAAFLHEKTILEDMIKEFQPHSQVIVNKKIFSDTTIKGCKSSTIIKTDRSRCKIQETLKKEGGIGFNEIEILDL